MSQQTNGHTQKRWLWCWSCINSLLDNAWERREKCEKGDGWGLAVRGVCPGRISRQKLINKSMERSHKQVVGEELLKAALHPIGQITTTMKKNKPKLHLELLSPSLLPLSVTLQDNRASSTSRYRWNLAETLVEGILKMLFGGVRCVLQLRLNWR